MRFFNTAGPVNQEDHYCISPIERIQIDEVEILIQHKQNFVLHAPRQSGKTSSLLALMNRLNSGGTYSCVYVNLENAQAGRENILLTARSIVAETTQAAHEVLNDDFPSSIAEKCLQEGGPLSAFSLLLSRWAENSTKPLILLFDEVDSLIGDALISLLRQLRSGYAKRPKYFPSSVVLCGVRDVRDYRIESSAEKSVITGGSCFNIKAESLRLGDFDPTEVQKLLLQHEKETGQTFTKEAVDDIWHYTQGQPWLVNALAYETCWKIPKGKERTNAITRELVAEAVEKLIVRRVTHLDQLADKLREPRLRRVIEPILEGTGSPEHIPIDDIDYVCDLGLIKRSPNITIANPIYREVIPRQLVLSEQETISHSSQWYLREDGKLDFPKLLTAFQDYFRQHSEHWLERFDYKEAGPQLLLQAFLQRVVNGGGRVEREYALGRGRTDLLITWPNSSGDEQRVVLELKVIRQKQSAKTVETDGLEQTKKYMDRCKADEGHLLLFDKSNKTWDEKIFRRKASIEDTEIAIWGL